MIPEFLAVVALAPVTETRLIALPRVASPGDLVSLVLENAESGRLRYGLPFRVQRRPGASGGASPCATSRSRTSGFRLPLLFLRPGERAGPGNYPLDLADGLPLGRDAEPGRYRIVRDVKVQAGPRLRLTAPFSVRRK